MAPKSSRQFSERDVQQFLELPSLIKIRERLPTFGFAHVVDERGFQERTEVYFRLVRPNKPCDVGMAHCDHWFHTQAGLAYEIGTTLKLWVSVSSEPGLNGLCFYPEANIEQLKLAFFEGQRAIATQEAILGEAVLPNLSCGDALLFRDDVIHAGALNIGTKTRCSIEVTFIPLVKC